MIQENGTAAQVLSRQSLTDVAAKTGRGGRALVALDDWLVNAK